MQIEFSVDNIIASLHQTSETCRIEKLHDKRQFLQTLLVLHALQKCIFHQSVNFVRNNVMSRPFRHEMVYEILKEFFWFCYFWMCRNKMRHRKFYVNAFRMLFNIRKFRNIRNIQIHWEFSSNLLCFRRWNTESTMSSQSPNKAWKPIQPKNNTLSKSSI